MPIFRAKSRDAKYQARQGDIFLVQVAALPKHATTVPSSVGEIVLARGEVTGHAHRIVSATARLWQTDLKRYLVLDEPAVLEHEVHKPITLQPGVYQVIRQREYEPGPLRERSVED